MRAGSLKHQIKIQEPTKTVDSMGSHTTNWSTYISTRAQILPVKGMEAIEHRKLEHHNVNKFWLRYYPNITADMRIKFNKRTYEILSVRNVEEKNRLVEITADELVT